MDTRPRTRVFISYAHADKSWMERFRKELKAALFESAEVWCDQDIGEGAAWLDRLAMELRGANVAFILATSDYLVSPWCRRELQLIRQKVQEKHIQNAFWVEVKLCAWERTELAELQSRAARTGRALSEMEEVELEREILSIVREVGSSV